MVSKKIYIKEDISATPTTTLTTGGGQVPGIHVLTEFLEKLSSSPYDSETSYFPPSSIEANEVLGTSVEHDTFPQPLLVILCCLEGNHKCVDCGFDDQHQYASVKFGTLMCQHCAYEHIQSGLDNDLTDVKSLTDDPWTLRDIIKLLEGGNARFLNFDIQKNHKIRSKNVTIGKSLTRNKSIVFRSDPPPGSELYEAFPERNARPKASFLSSITSSGSSAKPDEDFFFSKYKAKSADSYAKDLDKRVDKVLMRYCRRWEAVAEPSSGAFELPKSITDHNQSNDNNDIIDNGKLESTGLSTVNEHPYSVRFDQHISLADDYVSVSTNGSAMQQKQLYQETHPSIQQRRGSQQSGVSRRSSINTIDSNKESFFLRRTSQAHKPQETEPSKPPTASSKQSKRKSAINFAAFWGGQNSDRNDNESINDSRDGASVSGSAMQYAQMPSFNNISMRGSMDLMGGTATHQFESNRRGSFFQR